LWIRNPLFGGAGASPPEWGVVLRPPPIALALQEAEAEFENNTVAAPLT